MNDAYDSDFDSPEARANFMTKKARLPPRLRSEQAPYTVYPALGPVVRAIPGRGNSMNEGRGEPRGSSGMYSQLTLTANCGGWTVVG